MPRAICNLASSALSLFAAHALTGIIARPPADLKELPSHDFAAREAYRYADAMIIASAAVKKTETAPQVLTPATVAPAT